MAIGTEIPVNRKYKLDTKTRVLCVFFNKEVVCGY